MCAAKRDSCEILLATVLQLCEASMIFNYDVSERINVAANHSCEIVYNQFGTFTSVR